MSRTTQLGNRSGIDRLLKAVNVFVAAAALIWVVQAAADADSSGWAIADYVFLAVPTAAAVGDAVASIRFGLDDDYTRACDLLFLLVFIAFLTMQVIHDVLAHRSPTGDLIVLCLLLLLAGADPGGTNRRTLWRLLGYKSAALLTKLRTVTEPRPAPEQP